MAQVLCQFDIPNDENLLVGLNTNDDAAVYKIDGNNAIINTVDYFTPIVDEPYDYGQIAAANALSDVYAMGGKPLLALNIVCFPTQYLDMLKEILRGGNDKVKEAGVFIAGGHTIQDNEPKYGLSVTGLIKPNMVIKNCNAKPGDILILTKPIGTGVISTALKRDKCPEDVLKNAVDVMKYLNKDASSIMMQIGVNACTDITGFSLLGHAYEMAHYSKVSIEFDVSKISFIEGAKELASMEFIPGGTYRNKNYLKKYIRIDNIDETIENLLFDPQTSGGLLISVSEDKANTLYEVLNSGTRFKCSIVGRLIDRGEFDIYVK